MNTKNENNIFPLSEKETFLALQLVYHSAYGKGVQMESTTSLEPEKVEKECFDAIEKALKLVVSMREN